MTKRLFLAMLAVVVLTGQGCGGPSAAEQAAAERVTIKVWRVFDSDETFEQIMRDYRTLHPNVSFEYRQLRIGEYQDELLRAFATGEGPDVFSMHNTWVGGFEDFISPMPNSVVIPFTETRGTIKKETVVTLEEIPTISLREMRNAFLDVVSNDLVRSYQETPDDAPQDRIFGVPLSVDTLALYYNRDLLNAAGIAEPPRTWTEFQTQVEELSVIGPDDEIIQSGAAIGTSNNVERAFDIISLLMMQNGTPMTDARDRATFSQQLDDRTLPGAQAVNFYADFANPLKAVYTWNEDQPSSFEAFVSGQTAFFLGYSYHLPLIRARAARLNFDVAPVPQISEGREGRNVNYANYWAETVARTSPNKNWAWDFINFASSEEQVTSYLDEAGKPPARRSLINQYLENDDLTVFTNQLLTSRSWYRGNDAEVAEQAMLDLIDDVSAGMEVEDALRSAQNKVNQTVR